MSSRLKKVKSEPFGTYSLYLSCHLPAQVPAAEESVKRIHQDREKQGKQLTGIRPNRPEAQRLDHPRRDDDQHPERDDRNYLRVLLLVEHLARESDAPVDDPDEDVAGHVAAGVALEDGPGHVAEDDLGRRLAARLRPHEAPEPAPELLVVLAGQRSVWRKLCAAVPPRDFSPSMCDQGEHVGQSFLLPVPLRPPHSSSPSIKVFDSVMPRAATQEPEVY
ncbi:hypothetical protein CPLU01_06822 [Colletotrichum plurivorum]|uniref:Uncharacterized protein n=1 Tax=Colletotrichum plurivorum TaxID=2175906 RepID=A0A8H6KH68_9PEZI|nr:hypothetical protein CPLU01_06822 [Colletotrichum plurivorum]